MKKIKLTQGKYALVDDEDYEFLNQWKWIADKGYNTYYATRREQVDNKSVHIKMHRLIMDTKSGEMVDHINRNGLDNRKENLRNCNKQQNRMNSIGNKNSSSIYKGITFRKSHNKWEARIQINNKLIYLGLYSNKKSAAKMYDYMADKHFKDFAVLNFPNKLLTKTEFEKMDSRIQPSSSRRGVFLLAKYNKWVASIKINNKTYSLGAYLDEINAAKVYDYYAHKLLDKRAKLNFPNKILTKQQFLKINTRKTLPNFGDKNGNF